MSDLFHGGVAQFINSQFGIGHTLYATSRTKGKDGNTNPSN